MIALTGGDEMTTEDKERPFEFGPLIVLMAPGVATEHEEDAA